MADAAARPPVAVTMGDPAGVGGETALMAWLRGRGSLPPFLLLDDPDRLRRLAASTGLGCPVEAISAPAEARAAFRRGLPVLPLSRPVASVPGDDSTPDGAMTIEAIDRAADEAAAGRVAAVVTNPIRKSRLYAAGFSSPGHTEYLGERAGLARPPVMLLAGPRLKVVPVTVHLPLRDAVAALDADLVLRALRATRHGMKQDFGIEEPRIAVAGLNPHAGEDGHLGDEEARVVAPAIARLRAEGALVEGPLPSDAMFHEAARARYDVAVCMYHDQALIPLKTLDFEDGVNVTLGLPFVRTSPDHGTAYDIAGTAAANPSSFMSALRMARGIAARRAAAGADGG